MRDLRGVLTELIDQRLEVAGQDRLLVAEIELVGSGGDHRRCAAVHRPEDVPEAVGEPRRDVEVRDADGADIRIAVGVIPARRGVAGGHPRGDVLLEPEDVLDVAPRERVHDRKLRRSGVAEQVVDAVLFEGVDEQFRAGVSVVHGGTGEPAELHPDRP